MIYLKKASTIILIILLSSVIFLLGFQSKNNEEPNTYYQVYLDDQILGTIKSKKKLEQYIDKRGSYIKEKYDVENVYAPNGLDIRKITTFDDKLSDVKEVYNKIEKLKPFTIRGYQFAIKKDDETEIIYVTEKDIFKNSLEKVITTFVGTDSYDLYLNDEQVKIETTGTYINNVYIDENITIKETNIPVNETIYNDVDTLSQYLLFGTNYDTKTYTVKLGDTIESVAYDNKISVEEFLIANPEFTSTDNLLYPGQLISVTYANPLVSVMSEVTKVEDQTSYYSVEERQTDEMVSGSEKVIQQGENGVKRVTQDIVYKNGFIEKAEVTSQTEIKPTTTKIVLVGTKYVSGIGSGYWTWPTTSTSISSPYGYRSGEFHTGLDIYNYYGAPIYAADNGVVIKAGWYGTYGIFVGINHNNGYGTGYGHMSAIADGIKEGTYVERGQLIGYIGMTGRTTGPHVHFELFIGSSHPGYNYGAFLDPRIMY